MNARIERIQKEIKLLNTAKKALSKLNPQLVNVREALTAINKELRDANAELECVAASIVAVQS